jgi:hypothetical protein
MAHICRSVVGMDMVTFYSLIIDCWHDRARIARRSVLVYIKDVVQKSSHPRRSVLVYIKDVVQKSSHPHSRRK